eukprot:scaffold87251_cov31-Tisochrysis_lutea.AAC.3
MASACPCCHNLMASSCCSGVHCCVPAGACDVGSLRAVGVFSLRVDGFSGLVRSGASDDFSAAKAAGSSLRAVETEGLDCVGWRVLGGLSTAGARASLCGTVRLPEALRALGTVGTSIVNAPDAFRLRPTRPAEVSEPSSREAVFLELLIPLAGRAWKAGSVLALSGGVRGSWRRAGAPSSA